MASDLNWHYGPTDTDPDPGKMWCYDCGAEVFYIKAGPGDTSALCSGCHRTEPGDPPRLARRIMPPSPYAPRYVMNWTQPICDVCWTQLNPGRSPTRVRGAGVSTCCYCGRETESGIYIRTDPRAVPYPEADDGV